MSNKLPLHCMGASQEVGRSAFLLETDTTLLMDYGIKIFGKDNNPEYPTKMPGSPDACIISHSHMDHIGFLPYLYTFSDCPWYGTPPTRDLGELLLADSMKIMGSDLPYQMGHYKTALKQFMGVPYKRPFNLRNTNITFHDGGHIAGSAMVEINYQSRRILYTGDLKVEGTRLHQGAKPMKDLDTIIIDSTYALKEHPSRKDAEEKMMDEIEETIDNGGQALFPAFALGRSQELISVIRAHNKDVPIYLDGMGKTISDIYLKHGSYITDVKQFRKDIGSVTRVYGPQDRERATKEPGVIISSAGMLEGGPILGYLTNVHPNSKILFTGYCVTGTNGWKLRNHGYVTINGKDLEVDLPVEYIDFSAHAGRTDVLTMIKEAQPEKVVIVHSDAAEQFAEELRTEQGLDAVAPKVGETIEI